MSTPHARMTTGRIVAVVFGSLAALLALALAAGGTALVIIHGTQRDADGYYQSGTRPLSSTAYAITSSRLDLRAGGTPSGWIDSIGTVRIEASAASEAGVFIGIGRTADVDRYLAGCPRDVLTGARGRPFMPMYQRHPGSGVPEPPAAQGFWVAQASGPGRRALTWQVGSGDWTAVLMNADGSAGLTLDASAGVRTGLLLPVGLGLLGGGLLFAGLAALVLVLAFRGHTPGQIPAAPGYPIRLDARLEEGLSRWRWLVKWLLAIPHVVVLAFLWAAFTVLTAVAGVAILFTGRYPRGIFAFNLGVLRWTWRVGYYATTLGTDRYPPFSLDSDPDYPADLQIDYPERLSRGLVLVKWWLLTLPHYLIISLFGGGLTWWNWTWGSGGYFFGAGLIGILALVGGITLAITAHYPTQVYDFVLGMQRWTYRVLAYAALMRDEYPPFRLDTGGRDPAHSD